MVTGIQVVLSIVICCSNIGRIVVSEYDDFETLIWKGMEWMGGWTIAIYGTISLLGAIYGGIVHGLWSRSHSQRSIPFLDRNRNFNFDHSCCIYSSTLG